MNDTRIKQLVPACFVPACFVCFAILLAGCSDPVKSKIAGEWEVQKADRLVKRINQERINQDEGGNKSRMRIVFGFRGALTTQTAMGEIQREKSGTWDLVSFDEKESQMELDCDLGSGDVRTSITFLDANTIKLVPPNMAGTRSKLTFERKK